MMFLTFIPSKEAKVVVAASSSVASMYRRMPIPTIKGLLTLLCLF